MREGGKFVHVAIQEEGTHYKCLETEEKMKVYSCNTTEGGRPTINAYRRRETWACDSTEGG